MEQEPNPFKHVTFMDTNCAAKAGMVTVAGGAMGFLMALFMNAVEMRDMDYGRTKQSTRYVLRRDINKMFGMAKGFAIFGAFYSIFECQLEKLRIRDDATNSFLSCMFSSMVLAAESVGWKGLMMSGLGGGMFGGIMYYVQIKFMNH
ncbi:unnamed protein product [Paramecium sonneborni]|uniref:Mitochondrial import inner membrane translocase subunit TIM22 n=1 Tax=Paramecium sonneborni TaxID=65129 RepID=A0A8S1QB13_9CILI|nr:unnamed protein product [Paramecium sonneborni]